jgi:hypothetical protein
MIGATYRCKAEVSTSAPARVVNGLASGGASYRRKISTSTSATIVNSVPT